jgi:hypothetical protein
VVATAQLIVEIEPLIQGKLDELNLDPTNETLLDELRDLSIRTWSSESGLQLAETLDASDTLDATYAQLRESANAALPLRCERVDAGLTLFSDAAADCLCGRTLNPSTYCAAVASREVLDYIANDVNNGGSSRRSHRRLGICKVDTPDDPNKPTSPLSDLKELYDLITEVGAEEFCLEAECDIPLPPPASFIKAQLIFGGCLPVIDLEEMTICQEGNCNQIEGLLQVDPTAVIAAATDPRAFVKAELCLTGIDEVPFIGDVMLPALEILGISTCFAELDLTFWPLMGYLGFGVQVGQGLVSMWRPSSTTKSRTNQSLWPFGGRPMFGPRW